jgi:hypothetical protein
VNPDEREQAIAARRVDAGRTERKWVKGEFQEFPVYRVPTDLLLLNADNRRFRAERIKWEEELGRPLDPIASEDDEASIISILLDKDQELLGARVQGKPSKDTEALVADWRKRGQETALWIRPDGWVINGNRRLAILRRLSLEHGSATGTYDWVEVIELDSDEIADDDLFQMEAWEQLTEGYKLRYTNINLLLTLKEAAEREGVDWSDPGSISEVAHKIQDLVQNNPKYAEVQLYAIKYMDAFLEQHIQQALRYDLVMGHVERFRDVGKNMVWAERDAPELALDLLEIQFHAVQAGMGHSDMREIRKLVAALPERFEEAADEVREVVERWREQGSQAEETEDVPEESLEDDDEDEEAESGEAPPLPFPRTEVKRVLDIAIDARRSRDRNDAELAIRTATEKLRLVPPDRVPPLLAGASGERIRVALDEIARWLEAVRAAGTQ